MLAIALSLLLLGLTTPAAAKDCAQFSHCYLCSLESKCQWSMHTASCVKPASKQQLANKDHATISLSDCIADIANDGTTLGHMANNIKRLLQSEPTPSPLSRTRHLADPTWFTDDASRQFLGMEYLAGKDVNAGKDVTCTTEERDDTEAAQKEDRPAVRTVNVVCYVEPANVNPTEPPPPTLYIVAHWDTVPPQPIPVYFFEQVKEALAKHSPSVPLDCSFHYKARAWARKKRDTPAEGAPNLVAGKPWFTEMLSHIGRYFSDNGKANCNVLLRFLGIKFSNEQADYDRIPTDYYSFTNMLLADVDGADDNGSGMAVAIELLHMLAVSRDKLKYRIGVVFTGGEEIELDGARDFVASLQPGHQTVGAIVMDQVGRFSSQRNSQAFPAVLGAAMKGTALRTTAFNSYRANRLLLLVDSSNPGSQELATAVNTHVTKHGLQTVSGGTGIVDSVLALHAAASRNHESIGQWRDRQTNGLARALASGVHAASGVAKGLTGVTGNPAALAKDKIFMRSDHYEFWKRGLPAIQVTDTGNFRSPCYHAACDTTAPNSFRYAPWNGLPEFPGHMGVDHTARTRGAELDYTAMARLTRALFDIATTAGLTPVTVT